MPDPGDYLINPDPEVKYKVFQFFREVLGVPPYAACWLPVALTLTNTGKIKFTEGVYHLSEDGDLRADFNEDGTAKLQKVTHDTLWDDLQADEKILFSEAFVKQ